jgi:4-amino-4-deoxy-L-arabinose transferase-like glycosyltransferase
MTDGDVSHSSEKRLDTYTERVGLDLYPLRAAFLLFSLSVCLLSVRCLFPYQWGLILQWVEPTAEGGGLFLLVFWLLYFLSFFPFFQDAKLLF